MDLTKSHYTNTEGSYSWTYNHIDGHLTTLTYNHIHGPIIKAMSSHGPITYGTDKSPLLWPYHRKCDGGFLDTRTAS